MAKPGAGWLGGGAMSERAALRRLGWFRSFFLGGGLTGLSGRKKGAGVDSDGVVRVGIDLGESGGAGE